MLDEPAYTAAMEKLLVEAEVVTESDLTVLATARAGAVEAAVTGNEIDPTRVVIAATSNAEIDAAGWVPMKLKLLVGDSVGEAPVEMDTQ